TKVEYFSDMLSILFYKNSGNFGVAWRGGRPDFNYDSVVSILNLQATNQFTFTHELAHNQGCAHDYIINNNLTPPFIYRENPYFDYGHGFYDASIKKYSIVKQNPSNDSERILYFSNPDIT